MKRVFLFLAGLCAPLSLPAQNNSQIDQAINDAVQPVTQAVTSVIFYPIPMFGQSVPFIVIWLVVVIGSYNRELDARL